MRIPNNMATSEMDWSETITNGMQLTVIVEYYCENIIAVLLVHRGKEYRGVLMQCDRRFSQDSCQENSSQTTGQISLSEEKKETESPLKGTGSFSSHRDLSLKETSSTVLRFSYSTNPFLVNPRPISEIPTVEPKPVALKKRKGKDIRDIRLRPRQTLCSKCKTAIHDSHSHSHKSSAHGNQTESQTLAPASKSPLKPIVDSGKETVGGESLRTGLRKRKCELQSPMVVLEDIHHKVNAPDNEKKQRVDPLRISAAGVFQRRQTVSGSGGSKLTDCSKYVSRSASFTHSSCSVSNGESSAGSESDVHKTARVYIKTLKKDKSGGAKPTPAIKISIGHGAILKIPPRLPNAEMDGDKAATIDSQHSDSTQSYKKAKKAAKRGKDRDRPKHSKDAVSTDMGDVQTAPVKLQKKHKKKHRHKCDSPVSSVGSHDLPNLMSNDVSEMCSSLPKEEEGMGIAQRMGTDLSDVVDDFENNWPTENSNEETRPRLVYTWRQNEGLSRVAPSPKRLPSSVSPPAYFMKTSPSIIPIGNSPHRRKNASPARVVSASPQWGLTRSPVGLLKDYPLRSKSSGFTSGFNSEQVGFSEHGIAHTSEDSQSHSSGVDTNLSDFLDDIEEEDRNSDEFFAPAGSPLNEEEGEEGCIKPLMLKIQTQNVNGCILEEGREIRVGDIVWGKIQGFPWWPGRVSSITVTQRDNDVVITQVASVAWFGSNTMSHMHCSDLFPFLKDFKTRYNKKKKGQYRVAIKQATMAAQMLSNQTDQPNAFEDFDL